MSLTRNDLELGAKLKCTKALNPAMYVVGNVYEVTKEPCDEYDDEGGEVVCLTEENGTSHPWCVDSVTGQGDYANYHTAFELA